MIPSVCIRSSPRYDNGCFRTLAPTGTLLGVKKPSTAIVLPARGSSGLSAPRPYDAPDEQRILAAFLDGRSEATRRAYEADLKDFAAFMGDATPADAVARLLAAGAGPANAKVLEYRNRLSGLGRSAATVNRRLATLRSMTKLARMLGQIAWGIEVEGLDDVPYRDTAGPGIETLAQLFAIVGKRKDAKGLRDLAILRLLFDRGLRRGEIVGLDVGHLSLDGKLSILGKGRHQRETVSLPKRTQEALVAWLRVHPSTRTAVRRGTAPAADPMFVSVPHGIGRARLTGHGLYMILRDWSTRAKLSKIVRPHGVRHTAITKVLDISNGNLREGQAFARHRNANTTTRYDDARKDGAGKSAATIADLIP
jgi:integrase/recombinase XerC